MISFFYKNQKVNTVDYKFEQHRLFYDFIERDTKQVYEETVFARKSQTFPYSLSE